MDLVQLERFIEVVAAGSLRKAAQRLGLSQPTLSWSLHQLEASVGGPLLERHGRGSRLTEAGLLLLPHAQLLVNEGRRAAKEIGTHFGARKPELTIGATPPFTTDLVPRAIAGVLGAIPDVEIHVEQSESIGLLERVRSGALDLAFANPRSDVDLAGLDFEKIYVERYVLAARSGHPVFRRGREPGLETVAGYGWAMHRDSVFPASRVSPFTQAGLPMPQIRALVSSEHVLRPLVLATDLLAYVAHDLIAREAREGRIRIIDLPQLSFASPAGLLVRSNTTFTAPMKAFCREIRLVCRRLKTQGA